MLFRRLISVASALSLFLAGVTLLAEGPPLINYQGVLQSGGVPVTTPTQVIFAIWNSEVDGDSLWSEEQTIDPGATGTFTATLGTVSPIPDSAFLIENAYLSTKVGVNPEMTPRQHLLSVPYAFAVRSLNGVTGGLVNDSLVIVKPGNDTLYLDPTEIVIRGSGGDDETRCTATEISCRNAVGDTVTITPTEIVIRGSGGDNEAVYSATEVTYRTAGSMTAQLGTEGIVYYGATEADTLIAFSPDGKFVAGLGNSANGTRASVTGGMNNTADGSASIVSGGQGNSANSDYTTVSGGLNNTAEGNSSTVSGGSANAANGLWASVGGGDGNTADGTFAHVSGGIGNSANEVNATVGGGAGNTADDHSSTVSGGYQNTAGGGGGGSSATVSGGEFNIASGYISTIAGGRLNIADGVKATVAGGEENTATGNWSFAAGHNAKAVHEGAFVWADAGGHDFASTAVNEFSARCTGGARFVTAIDIAGTPTAGVQLAAGGGSWSSLSDRHKKENVIPVDAAEALEKVARMQVSTWNYTSQDKSIRHIGPMAQDVYAAFGVGEDERRITSIDADGIALAAIQGLYQQNLKQQERIEELETLVKLLLEDKH